MRLRRTEWRTTDVGKRMAAFIGGHLGVGLFGNITCLRIRLATAHTQTNRNDNNAHHVLFVCTKLLIEKSFNT